MNALWSNRPSVSAARRVFKRMRSKLAAVARFVRSLRRRRDGRPITRTFSQLDCQLKSDDFVCNVSPRDITNLDLVERRRPTSLDC